MERYIMLTGKPIGRWLIIGCLILPWVLSLPFSTTAAEPEKMNLQSGWSAPIRFFQKTISRADGNRCPMYPSCSRYALDAFNQHNFFAAWMLTSDRLLRCGHDEIRLAPKGMIRGTVKAHDPLSANTFWWNKP